MTDPRAGQPDLTDIAARPHPADDQLLRQPLTAEDAAAVAALPRGSALLIAQGSAGEGARFLLNSERAVAGRSQHAEIFLDDVTVSRKHAEFTRDQDHFTVRDIGSLNGTYVNRQRIDTAVLASGDEVQLGKFRLSFQASPLAPRDMSAGPSDVAVGES